ncbi:hypothetical protein [Mariprofundus ferrooxydans]|uniref:hypothetical protein n=1 Tax=Mariprofundus ferrooxydans TaxID=314344 RepID=UPI000362C5A5|nr:hypothetical protein [Mariprofundus ferrooxydans]
MNTKTIVFDTSYSWLDNTFGYAHPLTMNMGRIKRTVEKALKVYKYDESSKERVFDSKIEPRDYLVLAAYNYDEKKNTYVLNDEGDIDLDNLTESTKETYFIPCVKQTNPKLNKEKINAILASYYLDQADVELTSYSLDHEGTKHKVDNEKPWEYLMKAQRCLTGERPKIPPPRGNDYHKNDLHSLIEGLMKNRSAKKVFYALVGKELGCIYEIVKKTNEGGEDFLEVWCDGKETPPKYKLKTISNIMSEIKKSRKEV